MTKFQRALRQTGGPLERTPLHIHLAIVDGPLIFTWRGYSGSSMDDLLNAGAHVNTVDIAGDTPLHTVACLSLYSVGVLLDAGARIDVENGAGLMPMQLPGLAPGVEALLEEAYQRHLHAQFLTFARTPLARGLYKDTRRLIAESLGVVEARMPRAAAPP